MTDDFKVTVIMSNYNQEAYIDQAIQSVLNQRTNFPVKLLITDDYSTNDNSIEIIKKYEKQYPEKIKVLYNQQNGGYLRNILRAKAITKTPYFCLLDADDYWTDMDYLQKAVDYLDAHTDYVIYARNVVCLAEGGKKCLFIDAKIPTTDFGIDNYADQKISMVQTTGAFFRNVIFKSGIPKIMKDAVGTISDFSFQGDLGRFVMHLKYGKAHYEPTPCGVYRILSTGIWSRLTDFEKNIITAQCFVDYNKYYENKYAYYFLKKANDRLLSSLKYLNLPGNTQEMLLNIMQICSENKGMYT